MLLKKHHSEDRLRPQSYKTRRPPAEHPEPSLFRDCCPYDFHQIPLAASTHDPTLHDVDGTADCGRDEAGEQRGEEVRGDVVGKRESLQEHIFESVVGGQLGGVHEHCSSGVRCDTPEQRGRAFFADHPQQAIQCVLVVPPGGGRFGHVGLHAHVEDIGRVACHPAKQPR